MANPIPVVDLRLGKSPIANPDGTVPATVTGCKPVPGPSTGAFPGLVEALQFSGGAHVAAAPAAGLFDPRRYCVRLVLRVTSPVSGRNNLFESALPACSLQVVPSSGRGQFRMLGWTHNARNGWAGVDTANRVDLQLGAWLTLDFVCDVDTVGLFVNGVLMALSAFPDGTPVASSTANFVLGVHPDLAHWPFVGEIAQLQIWNGIPAALEKALDDDRGSPEWHIRLKQNTLLPGRVLGASQGDISHHADSGMRLQRFANAIIGHATGLPGAYVMYGAIRDRWEHTRGLAKLLGPLVSDEAAARAPGSRRSLFQQGAIYWSAGTGALEISGRPYIDYEQMGGSVSVLGLPAGAPAKIPGGSVQPFQRGQLYYRNGATRAYEVHGAILGHYLATGGLATWGFPVSDEEEVRLAPSNMIAPPPTGARQSRFEWDRATFLWSAASGAHEVHGGIRDAYFNAGGPGVPNDSQFNGLGLPISDEIDLPKWAGFGRFNAFQHGSVVWNGGVARVCPAFQIKLGLVQTEEDEGVGQGQNDLYFRINLSRNGTTVYAARVPNRGSFGGDNSHDLDLLIDYLVVPNDPELRLELSVEVWDEDDTSGDDHLGTLTKELNVANAWGLLDNDKGVFVATGLGEVSRFEWQAQPRQPPQAAKDFWNTRNPSTPTLIYAQYAAAFSDIDDDPEWTDPSDWAQRDVFARRVKRIAANGNCFGFCAEALHAWFGRGMGLPLARFQPGDWESIRNSINVKHIYQVGSDVLAHFQDQIEDRMKPRAIFLETRQRSLVGDPCALCVWTGADYDGTGHCVLPFAWDDTGPSWTIQCFDPNNGNAPVQLSIDPNGDTFRITSGTKTYSGAMLFAPWSALNHRQCSTAWDPNMLLLGLLICVVGADASTSGITDSVGDNLWMPGNASDERRSRKGQFAPVATMDGTLDGEILVRRVRPEIDFSARASDTLDLSVEAVQFQSVIGLASNASAAGMSQQPLPARLARALARATLSPATRALKLRDLLHGTTSTSDMAHLEPEARALGNWLRRQSTSRGPDFVHTLLGVRQGQFDYLTRWQLTATRLRCAIERGEQHRLEAGGLAGRMPLYRLTTQRDKLVSLEHTVRLGRGGDFARISLANLPARAGVSLNVAVRAGLAAVDVVTAGERMDVPVVLETWRGNQRRVQHFMAAIEGGMRLTPALHEPGAALKQARIVTMFGEAGQATLLQPKGPSG